MSEAISKAKLLEWWEKYPGWIKHAFMKELESGTFDLSPTDVDMKEIEERVSWLRQNGYKTDMQETLLTKLSEYESQIGELDTAHQLMHARNERLEAELSGITEKLAVKESEYEECKADALGLHKQLGEAVEALENYARCAL